MTLGSIVNKVSFYVKASPYQINEFASQFLRHVISEIRVKTQDTIDISLLSDPDEISLENDILLVRVVYINDIEIPLYSNIQYPDDYLTYTIDNESRKIKFSSNLSSSDDTLKVDLIKIITDISTINPSSTLDIPDIWIDSIVYFCVKEIFNCDDFFNPEKSLYFERKYNEAYRQMKRNKNVGKQKFDMGATL